MRQTLLFLFFVSCFFMAFSQDGLKHCGSDQMQQLMYNQFPQFHASIKAKRDKLNQHTDTYLNQKQFSDSDSVYIIPVVFHLIHNYGSENIDDSQLENAIEVLNIDYRNGDTDTLDIRQEFRFLVADCQIEFRLAKLDPYGNCTNGINRIADTLTYVGDHSIKSLIQWPPDQYLNIWVVSNAAGLAGHALNPADVDTLSEWDGIVIQHDYLGSIGTSSEFKSLVLTHEVGHYLNLQHTWGGNNAPNLPYWSPGDTANCGTDDEVDDTPNTVGWQTCNTAGTSCGTLDNVQNYMEYAYCTARMFTEGQKQRMRACLNSSIANRNNLWTSQNLAATGVTTDELPCKADFIAERTVICEGEGISFSDVSYHGIAEREWTFEGGNPITSSDSLVVVSYSTSGKYDVSLKSGNGMQDVDTTKADYITVLPATKYQAPYWETFDTLTSSTFENEWAVVNNDNENGWKLTKKASYSGSHSAMLENYSNPFTDRTDELISNTIDLSGLTDVVLSFRYAYAQKHSSNQESLKIYVSKDCGVNWFLRGSVTGSFLSTADSTDQPFYPSSVNEWKYEEITNIASSYLVSDFQVKFVFESGGGNNIFIEDIYVSDIAMGIEEVRQNKRVEIMPNPVRDILQLSFLSEIPNKIELINVNGKSLLTISSANNKLIYLPIEFLPTGVYFIKMIFPDAIYYDKFLKS